jgi:hypothetical protein
LESIGAKLSSKDNPTLGDRQPRRNAFLPHPRKQEAVADLLKGESPDKVAIKYGMNERTVFRYYQDLKNAGTLGDRPPKKPDPKLPLDETLSRKGTPVKPKPKIEEKIFDDDDDEVTPDDSPANNNSSKEDDENMAEKTANGDAKYTPSPDPGDSSPGGSNNPPSAPSVMIFRQGGIPVNMIIPPFIFTMFDMGKQADVIAEDADFDLWMAECVVKRFELDYRLSLGLNRIDDEEEQQEGER